MIKEAWDFLRAPQLLALEWLKTHVGDSSPILDISYGPGWFLATLEEAGFIPLGTETSQVAVESMRRHGFAVCLGTPESWPTEGPQPKALTLFDVLEHLPQPMEFLSAIHQRFPAAPLLLSVPSPKRSLLLLTKADVPPDHLTFWNERSIAEALQRAGYETPAVVFPRLNAAEVYRLLAGFLVYGGGPLSRGDALSTENNPSWRQGLMAAIIKRTPVSSIYRAGLKASALLAWPVAALLRGLGCSSESMLAIAHPGSDSPEDPEELASCYHHRRP